MASALAEAHIEAQRRLRLLAAGAVERAWRELGAWNREDVPRFLNLVVPTVITAQRGSVALTEAFIAQSLERQPLGVPADRVIAAVRGETTPEVVYERPFVTMWTALGEGKQFADAFSAGLSRATGSAAMDVQMAMRGAASAVQAADDSIVGYERVADGGACTFCQEVDTAFVKSAAAMALHNNCGCGLEPVTTATRGQRVGQKGQHGRRVAIHDHGELGPVLADPAHDFTPEALVLG